MIVNLNPPQIILVASDSINPLPLIPIDKNLRFGSVYKINFKTLGFKNGDNVMFDETKTAIITEGNRTYFVVDENNIYFTESEISTLI